MHTLRLPTGITVQQAKKDAKFLAKRDGITQSAALDIVANRHGLSNWPPLMQLLNQHSHLQFMLHDDNGAPYTLSIKGTKTLTSIVTTYGGGKTTLLLELIKQLVSKGISVTMLTDMMDDGITQRFKSEVTLHSLYAAHPDKITIIRSQDKHDNLINTPLRGGVLLIDSLEFVSSWLGKENIAALMNKSVHTIISCLSIKTIDLFTQKLTAVNYTTEYTILGNGAFPDTNIGYHSKHIERATDAHPTELIATTVRTKTNPDPEFFHQYVSFIDGELRLLRHYRDS